MGQTGTRGDYGMLRIVGYAHTGALAICVVFVDRCDMRRIVGLRRAKARAVRHYAGPISVGAHIGSADTRIRLRHPGGDRPGS